MKLDILEIVEKLIGNTYAIGETHHDTIANENIEVLGQLVFNLILQLVEIKNGNFDRYEHSRKINGKKANEILESIKEMLNE